MELKWMRVTKCRLVQNWQQPSKKKKRQEKTKEKERRKEGKNEGKKLAPNIH